MNLNSLRLLLDEKLQIWGYTNTTVQPNLTDLINEAYQYMAWQSELNHGPSVTFDTVEDQAEYTLPGTLAWKSVLDCYYGTSTLRRSNEHSIRRRFPTYLITASNVPLFYWLPRPNIIRLFPAPSTPDIVVTVYGIRAVDPLVADTDIPIVPDAYQQGIALYAAYLHISKYAKGEARQRLGEILQEYQSFEDALREEQSERVGMDALLIKDAPDAERIRN